MMARHSSVLWLKWPKHLKYFQIHSIAFDRMHSSRVWLLFHSLQDFLGNFGAIWLGCIPSDCCTDSTIIFHIDGCRRSLSKFVMPVSIIRVWNRILNFQDFYFLHLLIPNYQYRLCVLGIILESTNTKLWPGDRFEWILAVVVEKFKSLSINWQIWLFVN